MTFIHFSIICKGIHGHCVCFPQEIGPLCTILPNRKCDILTFVRKVNKNDLKEVSYQEFKVRRKKVLSALKWLKRHNILYHDICIDASALDWMEGKEEAQIETTYQEFHFEPVNKNNDGTKECETISENQTGDVTGDTSHLNMIGLCQTKTDFAASERQVEHLRVLENEITRSDDATSLRHFPPVYHTLK